MSSQSQNQRIWQDRVDPDFRHTLTNLLQQFPEARGYNPVDRAAVVHLYVSKVIDYETRDLDDGRRDFRLSEECWDVGAGNCQEKSLLVASLLQSIPKTEARTVGLSCEDSDKGHRILEIKFPFDPSDVCKRLRKFYRGTSHVALV